MTYKVPTESGVETALSNGNERSKASHDHHYSGDEGSPDPDTKKVKKAGVDPKNDSRNGTAKHPLDYPEDESKPRKVSPTKKHLSSPLDRPTNETILSLAYLTISTDAAFALKDPIIKAS